MTIGDIMEIEEKLGRRLSQEEIRAEELRRKQEIKAYANRHDYTDVEPFEVIRTISPICVEIRAMNSVQTKFPQDFHKGGFVGHFADNRQGQDYDYSQNPDADKIRIRWSKAKGQWRCRHGNRYIMSDTPYKFYDYNF